MLMKPCLSSQATYIGAMGQPWVSTACSRTSNPSWGAHEMRGKARVQQVEALTLIIVDGILFQDKSAGTHVFIK